MAAGTGPIQDAVAMDRVELPYTRDCFVCGQDNPKGLRARFAHEQDRVVCRLTPHPEACGFRTVIHGGILSSLLDEAMGWAPAYARRRMCVTGEMSFRFPRPVKVGMPLVVVGRFAEDKKLFWRCEGTIEDDQGQVYVRSKAVYVPMTAEQSALIERETLVYPPGTPKLFS